MCELFSTEVLIERDISIVWMKVEGKLLTEGRTNNGRLLNDESIAMFDSIQQFVFIIVECNAWTFYSATLDALN